MSHYAFPAQYDSLLFRHSAFPQHFVTTQNSATTLLVIANAIQVLAFTAGTKLSITLILHAFPLRDGSVQFQCVAYLVSAFTVHG